MRAMSNLECAYMARELAQLEGKHFSKAQQLEGAFRLKIGDSHVVIEPPLRICLAKYLPPPSEPSAFVRAISTALDNQKLKSASQLGPDRILVLQFEKHSLVVELFAKGNALLLDSASGKILHVQREESWKDRSLKRGEIYKPPPSSLQVELAPALSEKYIIVCLLNLPLGKDYAKDMLERCGIDEKKPGHSLSQSEISCLKSAYSEIISNQKPLLFSDSGKPVDFALFRLKKYAPLHAEETQTLSQAMEEFYAANPKTKGGERLEKLEHRLKEQQSALSALKENEAAAREKGDFIYSNFQEVEKLLAEAKSAGINKIGSSLNGRTVSSVDSKKKEIEIEL